MRIMKMNILDKIIFSCCFKAQFGLGFVDDRVGPGVDDSIGTVVDDPVERIVDIPVRCVVVERVGNAVTLRSFMTSFIQSA